MEPVQVTVQIELDAPPPSPREQIEARCAAELDVLREDLALPVLWALEVVDTAPGAVRFGPGEARLYVDGAELPLPRRRPADDGELAEMLVAALHTHREALVTPRVAEALWAAWAGRAAASPAELALLLRRMVRHRVDISRVSDDLGAWGDSTPQAIFERSLGVTPRLVNILLHPETAARYSAERAAARSAQGGPGDPLALMADGLFYELGVHIGECRLAGAPGLARGECRVQINDLRGRPIRLLADGEALVNDTPERLRLFGIDGRDAPNPANGNACAIIAAADAARAEQAGLTTWDGLGYLVLAASAEARAGAFAMLSLDALELLLGKLESAWPELVELARARVGERALAEVLRLLLEEEVLIRNMRLILETLLALPPEPYAGLDRYILFAPALRPEVAWDEGMPAVAAVQAAEAVRCAMRQYISHKHTVGESTLVVYLLDSELEELLRRPAALSAEEERAILGAIQSEVGQTPGRLPAILTTTTVRLRLQRLIRPAFPRLRVLSYQELSPSLNIQPIARVSLG